MLGQLAKGMKDGALGLALKSYLNERLREFGEVLDVQVDTGASRLTLRALLKGEKEAVSASIERYEIEREGEDRYITLRSFGSSRPWLTLLLTKLFTGKRYKLPGAVASLL
ncbi:MAG TPA: hypothetical protein VFV27_09725 [Nevskiaceae bacterium]|nr:hypothetical protein [Nevskiaceae bacterium]